MTLTDHAEMANASVKKLRELTRTRTIPEKDWVKHLKEWTGKNDRLIGVMCSAVVENSVEALLKSAMPNGPGKLFEPHQPLSGFSAKIQFAYSLKLIDADIRRNLDYIRDIRNVFAHRIAPTTFKTPEIAAVCALLSLGRSEGLRNSKKDMRERYRIACLRTGAEMISRSLDSRDAPPASLPKRHLKQQP